jgi:hypothetical protein
MVRSQRTFCHGSKSILLDRREKQSPSDSVVYPTFMRKIVGFLLLAILASGLSTAGANPAFASATYDVPDDGLSFDTRGTTPCTVGYGNSLTELDINNDPVLLGENDEVNFLKATDSLTYTNVATIGGQVIDARVTLASISGMQAQDFGAPTGVVSALDRLDKCDADSKARLIEVNFDNDQTPGGAEEAYFVLEIAFFLGGTSTPATLTNLKMNVEDVDSDQYLEVDNFTSTRLADGRAADDLQEYGDSTFVANGTSVTLSGMGTAKRFHATGSSSSGDRSVETDKHVVEVTYASVSSLSLKLGSYGRGSGSFDINFRGFSFTSDSGGSGGSGSSGSSESVITRTLAATGPDSSLRAMGVGAVGLVIVGAGLVMQAVRRRTLAAGQGVHI